MNRDYLLERLVLKLKLKLVLKLQYLGHLMERADSLEKTVMLGTFDGKRRRGWGQRMRWLDSIASSKDVNLSSGRWWRTEEPGVLQPMGLQRVGDDLVTEQR